MATLKMSRKPWIRIPITDGPGDADKLKLLEALGFEIGHQIDKVLTYVKLPEGWGQQHPPTVPHRDTKISYITDANGKFRVTICLKNTGFEYCGTALIA